MSAPLALFAQQQGEGPPLLLLHGLGADHQDWRDVVPHLVSDYRVIAPDLRGFGASPRRPGPYTPWQMARDIMALMDAEGIAAAPVVGHSMGGAVAMSLALLAPERISRLVIANSVPSFRPQRPREFGEIALRLFMIALLGPRRLGALMAHRNFPDPDQGGLRALVEERSAINRRWVYMASLLALTRWSVRERLPEITMPTLVVASERDYFPVADVRSFAEALPRARFEMVPGARHGLPLERGELLAGLLRDFLGEPA